MAYFKWRGVDLTGAQRTGKMFARTEKDLNSMLIEREIALLSCRTARPYFFSRSVNLNTKVHFFRQLSVLLDAGVMLPDALEILGNLIDNMKLRDVICSITADVQAGFSLSESLSGYPAIFDSLMIRMVHVGQEAGKLAPALQQLSSYLEITQTFRKKLKSASVLPLLTLGFFALIATAIFVLVIPRFADIFRSMKRELPAITRFIIRASELLRSSAVLYGLFAIALVLVGIHFYMKSMRGKETIDRNVLKIPWVGQLVKNSSLVYFLHSISMLVMSGVRLVKAMNIAAQSIKNSVLRAQVLQLEKEVTAGNSLSRAMQQLPGSLFEQDLVAIAKVGEESGRLGAMLKRGAAIYQEKVNRSLTFFSTIFQPMLMIILGLLITLLIFAIYLPVFSLSSIV